VDDFLFLGLVDAMKLHVSPKLTLPVDTVTQTIVVYGGKGMGKTNFGRVLIEELDACGQRFAVLDPIGVWYGAQYSADGRGAGLEVVVLGGLHGDIPIEPTGGAIVADLVADEDANVIVDISRRPNGSMWSIGERTRFVTDYATRLYERQGERRRPIMQVIDEAGRFVPQMIPHGAPEIAKCVGVIERLVEEGRNVGIGVCLITQRSARMNKSVSELAECMVAFRTVGPRSVDAIIDWFGEHVEKSRWKALVESLRSLPRGCALVVSPGWLAFEGEVDTRLAQTFDTSATPTGQERRVTGRARKPDLKRYEEKIAATVEKAKADDPRELRRRVADLEKQLRGQPPAAPKVVEKPVLTDEQVNTLADVVSKLDLAAARLTNTALDTRRILTAFDESRRTLREVAATVSPPVGATNGVSPPARRERLTRSAASLEGSDLSKGQFAILQRVVQLGTLTKGELTTLTKYRRSTRNRLLYELHALGCIQTEGQSVAATDEGRRRLGPTEELPTGNALRVWYLSQLPEGQAKMLEAIASVYPDEIARDDLDDLAGYKRSTRNRLLQELSSARLITSTGRSGPVRANDKLFDGEV
jgi:uncharacterized protein